MSNIKLYLNTLRLKGYLAYEYNPFHNYQTDTDLYIYDDKYIIPANCALNPKNGEILKSYFLNGYHKRWVDKNGIVVENVIEANSLLCRLYASAGSLIDLDTDLLNFDINHPVDIEVLPSYDGSVNLILNDNKNIPRLINSRFSVREKNTYEIVDRIGENDTNIYNSKTFDKDTSLYFLYESNPVIEYRGFVSGILPVGSYCFYFTYCDSDDNESDFISESGLIPVFIGGDSELYSMNGGIKNENSNKGIKLKLTNIDSSYNYLKIYYVRNFADYQQNKVIECKKIYRKYPINSGTINLLITGNEQTEDIDPNILNLTRFNPKSVLTLTLCKNILFFGNIVKNTDNYKELLDCALRIIPELVKDEIETPDHEYISAGKPGYYNSTNIYNKVGYFNLEYYRFGVVFIYKNGTLSNVYNTLGLELTYNNNLKYQPNNLFTYKDAYKIRQYIKVDDDGWIKSLDCYQNLSPDIISTLNNKGVCKLNYNGNFDDKTIFGIKFNIDQEILDYLREELGIRGFFFVRQKCVPTILALCYILPMDKVLKAPVLLFKDGRNTIYQTECFVSNERTITNDYESRLYYYKYPDSTLDTNAYAAICPDFSLNLPYYNQIFNGNKFTLKQITEGDNLVRTQNSRFYKESSDKNYINKGLYNDITITSVTEDVPTVALKDKVYKLNIGELEEAFRFEYAELDKGTYDAGNEDFDAINESTNLVRGHYSPYLAIYSSLKLETGLLYNIYLSNPNYNLKLEYLNRMNSSEPFYAISDRYNFSSVSDFLICWRGDCYINLFTYRLNRNFNDPSLPNNDKIIDKNTWKDHYKAENPEEWTKISRSDINAVQLGSWITLKLRSGVNYALRSVDHSYVSEEALMGLPRTYYPISLLAWRGNNKLPDSYLYNDAFRSSLGYKCYFTLQDINYIKNTFSNRILYSAIAIQDSFKNNYRDSLSTYFRDYSQEYGSILKLVEQNGNLVVIFEHGIGIATINERILLNGEENNPVFINTQNVLPEELIILTNTYGTLWPESVVKSEVGYIYGVDTIAKKIWRIKGLDIELLSDFKVNKFLIDNITLEEKELYPIIGLKNIKTHYNNNKKDILFTFYDDVYKDEEKVWNLCFNELLDLFVTFYSWVPSYSENIDTKFFTFNRDTSKALSLLYNSNYNIPDNYGVLLNTPIIDINEYDKIIINGDENYYDISDVEWNRQLNEFYEVNYSEFLSNSESDFEWGSNEDNNVNISINDNDYIYSDFEWINDGNYDIEWIRIYNIGRQLSFNSGIELFYRDPGISTDTIKNSDGTTILKTKYNLQFVPNISFELLKDRWGNYKLFNITNGGDITILNGKEVEINKKYNTVITIDENDQESEMNVLRYFLVPNSSESILKIKNYFTKYKVMYLYILPKIDSELDIYGLSLKINFKPEIVAFTLKSILENPALTFEDKDHKLFLTTDFYLHGLAGIFNVAEGLYPTYWYGETHPFEFEFIVNDKIGQQKIFTNLEIISNKAEPESFHFEVEGDNYEFSSDKRAMYVRLEATKELYLNLGSDILFNRLYTDTFARMYTLELYYRKKKSDYENKYTKFDRVYPIYLEGLVQQVKSTIFPLYYERIDTYNDIYHKYQMMKDDDGIYDFLNLSGSEIAWNRDLNLFNIITHIKNNPINLVGRMRGNSYYKEGKWSIQIPSIIFNLKNEEEWTDGIPPIIINSSYDTLPNDLTDNIITEDKLPNIYTRTDRTDGTNDNLIITNYINIGDWTSRKETRIRDKWIKIRVRYSGKNLAIIHSLITLYNISYS